MKFTKMRKQQNEIKAVEWKFPKLRALHSTQYTVHSTQHTVHSTQYTAHSTQYTAHSTQYTAHSTQHTAHSTQHTVHSTQHTVHSTQNTGTSTTNMFTNRTVFIIKIIGSRLSICSWEGGNTKSSLFWDVTQRRLVSQVPTFRYNLSVSSSTFMLEP
jgi:hypothetical protein